MDKQLLKQKVCRAIDANKDKICEIGLSIYKNPQLGYKETFASDVVQKTFGELGLKYESGLGITGVKAKLKDNAEGPNVCIMGELDAVVCPDHPDAAPDTGAAHCCGHFGQITSMLASAIGLSAVKDEISGGNVTFLAVPAEECVELEYREGLIKEGKIKYLGGKQELIHLGVYDDIDMAMMVHGNNADKAITAANRNVGFIAKNVKFIGKEAHAGGAPHMGINALNAAEIGLMAMHAQRETFKDEDHIRVHPIMTKGGDLVNVIPADVRLETYVRGASAKAILDASAKVTRAFEAGGMAVGAETIITDIPGYMPGISYPELEDVIYKNLVMLLGEEHAAPASAERGGGSSDCADIQAIMPAVQANIGGASGTFHGESYRMVDSDLAYLVAAKALACTAIDLLAGGAEKGLHIKETCKPPMTKEQYLREWGKLDI